MDEDKNINDDRAKKSEPTTEEKLAQPDRAGLAECEKQRDEYLSGWQRARADFLNYKKEEVRRMEDLLRFGTEDMMKDLIGVLDSFDFAIAAMENLKSAPTPAGSESRPISVGIEKGIYMIRSKLEEVLKQRGLERIPMKTGQPFDPLVAEAIAEIESDQPPGTVLEEIESGYRLYDKIVRPARVKVSKGQNKQ